MAEDDYTLMSSKDVAELKQDVDYLKRNPLGGSKEGKTLLQSIDRLNDSIFQLIEIFKEAGEQVKAEEREADVIAKRIDPISKQLAELSEQNQKIAKGLVAVADIVSSRQQERPQQERQRMPPMGMQLPRPIAPIPKQQQKLPPIGSQQMGNQPMPPPPGLPVPKKDEKKGILGFLKK